VRDLREALGRLVEGAQVLAEFQSEAFAGRACAFVAEPSGRVLELAEMTHAEFFEHFERTLAADRRDRS
jgi:hypothetical protein